MKRKANQLLLFLARTCWLCGCKQCSEGVSPRLPGDARQDLSVLEGPVVQQLESESRQLSMAWRSTALPSNLDRFQSALTHKTYKASAMSARALKMLSLLMAYQAEVCEKSSHTQYPALWEEVSDITDLYRQVQRCTVQATEVRPGEGQCDRYTHRPRRHFWPRSCLQAAMLQGEK